MAHHANKMPRDLIAFELAIRNVGGVRGRILLL